MQNNLNRRQFIGTAAAAGVGLAFTNVLGEDNSGVKPAILGGNQAHPEHWPSWPVFDETEEKAILTALRSGKWFRYDGGAVQAANFEDAFAKRAGTKHCIATASGTTALTTALGALEIGPGDEVILPPYTFVATYNAVVLNYALPIFVDIDLETFQIDPAKIEAAITENTKAIIPVHIGGNVADMDRILAIGKKHNIPVIEDACQAHLSEWRGKVVGNWGTCGCFSFQASKNLNAGEGGAIVTNDDQFAYRCELFHDQGRSRGSSSGDVYTYSGNRATNARMTEWQGAILQAQMTRLEAQSNRRWQNAQYLNKILSQIPGISPARLYDGCTRSSCHLYMFRYNKDQFAGLDRSKFVRALDEENIAAGTGYFQLTTDTYVTSLANNRHYTRLYSKETLARWKQQTSCPQNAMLCDQTIWLPQKMLLGTKAEMDRIAEAIQKIQKHAGEIAKV